MSSKMKNLLLFLVLTLPFWVTAQNTSGVITYSEVIKNEWTPPADMDPAMKAQIEEMRKHAPKTFTVLRELSFNQEMAYFRTSPKQEVIDQQARASAAAAGNEGRGGFRRMMMNSNTVNYWDIKKGKYLESRELFEKPFLIKDDVKKLQWKVMGEAKQIAGFVCQKAVTTVDSNEVVGWFCPTIPVPAGPNGYGQLPGMILELVTDKGRITLTADTVEFKPIATNDFEQPKGGKVVTRAEYDEIFKEKMKEMREEWQSRMKEGGGGQMRVIHQD
jgi:GLPGLI family protein